MVAMATSRTVTHRYGPTDSVLPPQQRRLGSAEGEARLCSVLVLLLLPAPGCRRRPVR